MALAINIRFLGARNSIFSSMLTLANPDGQKKYWLDPVISSSFDGKWSDEVGMMNFHSLMHALFDDTVDLDVDARGSVGDYFVNEDEADAVQNVVAALRKLLDEFGPLGTAEEFVSSPEWPNIVSMARMAVAAMEPNMKTAPTS